MKKFFAVLIIVSLFYHTSCVSVNKPSFNVNNIIATYKVTILNSTKYFSQGEKGEFKIFLDRIQLNFISKSFDIIKINISSIHYSEDLKKVFQKIKGPRGALYWRENPYIAGGIMFMRIILLSLIIGITIIPIRALFPDYIVATIYFKDNDNDEFISVKMKEVDFNQFKSIMKMSMISVIKD